MKATSRSPPGRPNPAPAKAEVNKLAGQGKDGTDSGLMQDKTQDGAAVKDKTLDSKQVPDKTESKPVQEKTEAKQVQDKTVDGKEVQDKTMDGQQGQNKTETRQEQDGAKKTGAMTKEKTPETKANKESVPVNAQVKVLNDTQVKYKASAGEGKDSVNGEAKNKGKTNPQVNNDKATNDVGAAGHKTDNTAKEQGSQAEQNGIKTVNHKTSEARREAEGGGTAGPKSNPFKDSPQASHETKPKTDAQTGRPIRKVTIKDKDDEEEGRKDTKQRNGDLKKTDKESRSKQRRSDRRKYEGDDEESDGVDDHLAMDNALVRHLLPHMSPALLPKAMQQQNSARDYSSNSEEEAPHSNKVSLNVIKESEGEDSEEASDDEMTAPPPTSLSSLRRHSFHHFPAPPTKSQSENAEKVRALLQAVEEEELEKMSKKLGEKTDLVRQHLGSVENRLFDMFGDVEKKTININKFLMGLTATGMRPTDPRLKQTRENLKKLQEKLGSEFVTLDIDYDTFMGIIAENLEIVLKAFSAAFIIPDFQGLCKQVEDIYTKCFTNHEGQPAQYIPQLARYSSKYWGVSVCTVDGQRFSLGDVENPFTIQSCSKPLTYAIGLGVNGTDYMHKYVGMEPSGRYFNELVLDYCNKPHNPMINSGAIMTAAIIKPELSAADRFDFMFKMYKRLAGDEHLGFNNSVFLSERECADRNFALAYFMRENKCFPENHKLQESLDFYFQLCSLEITAESGAVMAATLANGGLNPLTGDPVLTEDAVRNTLTLMHSCGMYNYSGQFAFHVGLPAKSGVSGCILLVIPNTMGICLWSPPLDTNGNSCRGVQFCMEMVSRFNFHNFDNLRGFSKSKQDPRMAKVESKAQIIFDLLFSAAAGDMSALRRHSLAGTDMQAKDYDGRTALHVATSEGHEEIVEFLLNNCNVEPLPRDRWDRTPLDDAESFDRPKCAKLIQNCCRRKGIKPPISYKAYMELSHQSNGPLLPINSS